MTADISKHKFFIQKCYLLPYFLIKFHEILHATSWIIYLEKSRAWFSIWSPFFLQLPSPPKKLRIFRFFFFVYKQKKILTPSKTKIQKKALYFFRTTLCLVKEKKIKSIGQVVTEEIEFKKCNDFDGKEGVAAPHGGAMKKVLCIFLVFYGLHIWRGESRSLSH